MAIVKLNKLSIIGLETEKEAVLTGLQALGAAELSDPSERLKDADWAGILRKESGEDRVSELDARVAKAETVLESIARYSGEKAPLFAMRRDVPESEYAGFLSSRDEYEGKCDLLFDKVERWNACKTEENSISAGEAALAPWEAYDLPLELSGTKYVRIFTGVIPSVADAEGLKQKVGEATDCADVEILSRDAEQQYLAVFALEADQEKVLDVLKGYGFMTSSFKGLTGTVAENREKYAERREALLGEEKELESELAAAAADKPGLEEYCDELLIERDRARAVNKLLATGKTFYLEGYIREDAQEKAKEVLEAHDCWYEFREPEKGEETPVLMENSSLIYPVQAITELYSLPKSTEVDPTPIFAFFYILFFGMMFADIAYGLILAGLCFFALKKYKPEGMAYRLLKTLVYCGISTAIWGVLFGGFFGDMIPGLKPLWLNPLDNAMFILGFSCVLGVIHLFVGMGIKAYMLIRDGRVFDAVCDVFIWYVFIIGLGLMLFGKSFIGPGAASAGKWMAIAGAAWIVGCEFIRGKGIGKAVGLWNLYGTTGYLADILSYSRLLALGLASAVIAQVFNMLGRMLGKGVVGVIGFIIIAVIGHTVNFLINALGSFVHASRLQYVEFFGKFYEGGGTPFRPLERDTKHVKIVKEDK